jgi:hypothetical protein
MQVEAQAVMQNGVYSTVALPADRQGVSQLEQVDGKPGKVPRLHLSLYRLKQSPRVWCDTMGFLLKSKGFVCSR